MAINRTGPKTIGEAAGLPALPVEERRRRAAAMFLDGMAKSAIARALRVDNKTITRDIADLERSWRQAALVDYGEARARELARLNRLESEAWEAYERSKGSFEETSASQAAGGQTTARKVNRKRDGDPRFLAIIARCSEMRTRLLGIALEPEDAPVVSNERDVGVRIHLPENYRDLDVKQVPALSSS